MRGMHAMTHFNPIFLIAVPQLLDPNFKRSVILIVHHDREGAFGLVLNQRSNFSLKQFAKSQRINCHHSLQDEPVFVGGPVEPYRGFILHGSEAVEEKQEILPGLYLSGSTQALKFCLETGVRPFRFILGHSGWEAAQLEREMQTGSWIAAGVNSQYIFLDQDQDTWDALLHDMGVDPARLAQGVGIH